MHGQAISNQITARQGERFVFVAAVHAIGSIQGNADATLIAAAPELLAALDEVGAALDNWNNILRKAKEHRVMTTIEETILFNSTELLAQARAAIAKAKGTN
jgi:hypothetical protein